MPRSAQYIFILFALGVLWMILVSVASAVYRRAKGKAIFRPQFQYPLFLETWRSGRSLRNLVTRFFGARNCLWIAVDRNLLIVAPHFPMTLMFFPEIFGLEFAVTGDQVRSVKRKDGLFGSSVRVSIERKAGREETLELWVRDPDGFMQAIESIRRQK